MECIERKRPSSARSRVRHILCDCVRKFCISRFEIVTFRNQPLFEEGIQMSGRTAAPFPPASLSGEESEGGVAAVSAPFSDQLAASLRYGDAASIDPASFHISIPHLNSTSPSNFR